MKQILVAFDGSESARRALQHAIAQVTGTGDRIHLLTAYPAPMLYPEIGVRISYQTLLDAASAGATKLLEPAEEELRKADVSYTKEVTCGSPGRLIAERAKSPEFAGIVMGTHGMGALKGLILGSVATQVVHLAEVPVTLVK